MNGAIASIAFIPGAANFTFADGSVRTISDSIKLRTLAEMVTRAGEEISESEYVIPLFTVGRGLFALLHILYASVSRMLILRSHCIDTIVLICLLAGYPSGKKVLFLPYAWAGFLEGQAIWRKQWSCCIASGAMLKAIRSPWPVSIADGTFTFTTFHANDGAPPGEYAITVEFRALQTTGEETIRNWP